MTNKYTLKKVIIERNSDGTWDIIREREESGEGYKGARTLDEAFAFVKAIYDENGEAHEKEAK